MVDETQGLASSRAAGLLSNWRLTPATMMAHLDSGWIPAKWLQYLSLEIARCIANGNQGLLISAPPRHGKSRLSTIATPLWVLENFPNKNVIVATYGEELSTDFTRDVRDIIKQNQASLKVRLRKDAQRVTNILTTEGGGLKAVGLQGTITGRGADVLIVDDYIKNYKEAMSPAYLDGLWNWWLTVARTRLEPGAVVIILATRWVANDLHGRLMKRQKETGRNFFRYIELPAIAEEHDQIGRKPGEVLFPERYDEESILAVKAEVGTRWFSAMFQQHPEDSETAVFNTEWFKKITVPDFERRYEEMLKSAQKGKLRWIRAWDLASTAEAGDYTSGTLALYNKETEEFFIRNITRGQFSSYQAESQFKLLSKEDHQMAAASHVRYCAGMEREPGSSGAYTINHFEGLLREEGLPTKLVPHPVGSGKLLNAQPLAAAAERGKVYLVCDYNEKGSVTGWAKEFLDEAEFFPESENDDQIDSSSIAYKLVSGKTFIKPTFGRHKTPVSHPAESKAIVAKKPIGLTFGRRLRRAS